ncbi:MAG: hypothetical protein KKA42_05545 [candidate division Zixibacteria bacterium]|nr:hypothetical protein [candidate division Zixibacteria bacterium]
MLYPDAFRDLADRACPSIRYRVHREILGTSHRTALMRQLQQRILDDARVQEILALVRSDGWLGDSFHGVGGIEHGLRLLLEKGVEPNHPVVAGAVRILAKRRISDPVFSGGIGKVGPMLDSAGLGGPATIRAVLMAQAGAEGRVVVKEEVDRALASFAAVTQVDSVDDITVTYRGKRVFRPGAKWPSIYHLRLLAYTHGWRTRRNQHMVARAIDRLVDLSPLPDMYLRRGTQTIAPASFAMQDLAPDMNKLDGLGWMTWFHRTELLARAGVIRLVPALGAQIETLADMLDASKGQFVLRVKPYYFATWGAYSGMMLEADWRSSRRRINDLTFRCLLILHYAGEV